MIGDGVSFSSLTFPFAHFSVISKGCLPLPFPPSEFFLSPFTVIGDFLPPPEGPFFRLSWLFPSSFTHHGNPVAPIPIPPLFSALRTFCFLSSYIMFLRPSSSLHRHTWLNVAGIPFSVPYLPDSFPPVHLPTYKVKSGPSGWPFPPFIISSPARPPSRFFGNRALKWFPLVDSFLSSRPFFSR